LRNIGSAIFVARRCSDVSKAPSDDQPGRDHDAREVSTAAGGAVAISIPGSEAAVIRHLPTSARSIPASFWMPLIVLFPNSRVSATRHHFPGSVSASKANKQKEEQD
jgi:hypothetical protein